MRRLLYLALIVAGISLTNQVLAIGTPDHAKPQSAAQWCYGLVNGSGAATGTNMRAIISPLVECFTDTDQGIIPSVTVSFLEKTQANYVPIVTLMFIVAIAYYGARMMIGDVQRLKASTFILALKIAGVLYFFYNATTFYTYMIGFMQDLSQIISDAGTTAHSSGFCVGSTTGTGSAWQNGLWARWDCIFQYILGFSKTGFAAASIVSFLFLMIFSASAGIIVFFMGLFLIFGLLFGAFRFVHVYLMSVLSLSFMFCLGYLFVPLVLFRNTFDFFRKFLTLTLGFILTPILMFGFMAMMLVALDIALFSGPYSVFCMIGGIKYCGTNTASGAQLFSNITGNTIASGTDPNSNPLLRDTLWSWMYIGLNSPSSLSLASGIPQICTSQNGGWMGWLCDMNIPGSLYMASGHPEAQQLGVQQTALNLSALASGAGSVCILTRLGMGGSGYDPVSFYSACPYLENVLVSLCVAGLFVYIMIGLLPYLPSLSSNMTQDIVSQDVASFGAKVGQSSVFGEDMASGMLNVGRESLLGAAKGGEEGGEGVVSGGMAGLGRGLDSLLSGKRGGSGK